MSLTVCICHQRRELLQGDKVGVSGMSINRGDIYQKELDFLISSSYGPGRYDKNYEEKGLDYPYSYVRWTENRNMSEYLRLVYEGKLKLNNMISKIYPIEEVTEAFDSLLSPENKSLMVILDYGKIDDNILDIHKNIFRKVEINTKIISNKAIVKIALIGAGGFATGVHLPNILKLSDKFSLHAVVDKIGSNAKAVAQQFKGVYSTTDVEEIIKDKEIDLVMITTRHDSHAQLTLKFLQAGKHVFVEKPLAVNKEEIDKISEFYKNNSETEKPILMVGFNRRFSKYATEIKKHTSKRINPLFINYKMNANYIPLDHWVHEHGGRIIGEACHIIDLMTYFTESTIESINYESLTPKTEKYSFHDNKSIILKYFDGSICIINYFSVGNKEYPKEIMEIHFDEKTIIMNDYKTLKGYGVKVDNLTSQVSNKGHYEELLALHNSISNKESNWPINLSELIETTYIATEII